MKKTIFKATVLMFILSLIGKLIGFLRSMIIASSFGADNMTDAYYLAYGVNSNILYAITMSVSVAFLPMYIKKKEEKGAGESYCFSTRVVMELGIVALLLTAIIMVFAPFLVKIMASSYSQEEMATTVLFLRVMSVGIVFSLMANLFQTVLNAEKVYEYAAFSSIVNSLVLIGVVLLFQGKMGIMSLVIATPLSYLLQFLFLKLRSRPYIGISVKYGIWEPGVKNLVSQAFPVLISNTTIEINQLIDRMLLVSIEEGAVTTLSYSGVLFQFAASVISIPFSTVSFTELSLAYTQKNREKVRNIINKTIRLMIMICIPVVFVMFMKAETIVYIVYGRGKFSEQAVLQTACGLAFYAFCLIPECIKQIITKAFYSVQETRAPMILGVLEVVVNIISSIFFSRYYGIAGVVIGTAFASTLFCIVLVLVFSWKKVNLGMGEQKYLLKLAAVSGILFWVASRYSLQNNSLFGLCIFSIFIFGVYAVLLLIFRDTLFMGMIKGMLKKLKIGR